MDEIVYKCYPAISNDALNELFRAAWPEHTAANFEPVLQRSLVYVCAYYGEKLVGFVYLAWDGGIHAFLLDPTVNPDLRRRGIGRELVRQAVRVAQKSGIKWVHVDFEPHLREFYAKCGFRPTEAGLLDLMAIN